MGRKWVEGWRDYSGSPVPAVLLPRGSIDFFPQHVNKVDLSGE